MTHDPLFESFDLNELSFNNRVGLAPMTRTSATEEGRPTERMARYYASFARGGFPFLISESIYTDTAYSQGYPNQPGLATDPQPMHGQRSSTQSMRRKVPSLPSSCMPARRHKAIVTLTIL